MKSLFTAIFIATVLFCVPQLNAQNLPPLAVALKYDEAPDLKEWAQKAAEVSIEQYPFLVAMLDSEGFTPADSITIIFREMEGVAHATRREIHIAASWIRRRPDDIGMVVHELIHILQAYGGRGREGNRVPMWVTEGIADYLRFFWYERNGDVTCRVNPDRARYTDAYRTTAAFFDWIVRTQDAGFIKRLNAACRGGTYSIELFQEYTGHTVDELWDKFIVSVREKAAAANANANANADANEREMVLRVIDASTAASKSENAAETVLRVRNR